jgi:hypothetical protein
LGDRFEVIVPHRVEDSDSDDDDEDDGRGSVDSTGVRGHSAEGYSASSTTEECWPMWDLRCFIAKSNDDLRQEVCVLQMMETMAEIFTDVGLGSELWLQR